MEVQTIIKDNFIADKYSKTRVRHFVHGVLLVKNQKVMVNLDVNLVLLINIEVEVVIIVVIV